MKKYLLFPLVLFLLLLSCRSAQVSDQTAFPAPQYVVFPHDIPADYEIIGEVRTGGEGVSSLAELHLQLAQECARMGGDMIIQVEEESRFADPSEIYQRPSGYRELAPPFPAEIEPSYRWGKGTVIRFTSEEQKKAFFSSQGLEKSEGICPIAGVVPPR
ncbi:MAG TPA: hypothetical protein PKJ77_04245 [Thermodesulfobacteriota bacterium]|nr:hypothetical protein [Deltaproteobacteria bacterium]HNR13113.1 hypothetical protein [Thermodesulfobacteriota bacterium]HNU72849.1 hypothetical protein [Thermodesulfobacteriota bacterium]HOC38467.1 hypothetical protein [Thermodesulfobacteriota bacterium]